ncbi:hypothetical protein GALMADRAFT_255408 [Galerina marginata CBS 339.88]|uniref:Uncharacterized protein n=1 Tax=Galerina marginata (strain CBS 339.88) TaxID=685588 RepID=A0A067SGH4_GALM3|nr:hypothetical protein GALMADRAFT_255408 [Galerina marginata CBS 339.88]
MDFKEMASFGTPASPLLQDLCLIGIVNLQPRLLILSLKSLHLSRHIGHYQTNISACSRRSFRRALPLHLSMSCGVPSLASIYILGHMTMSELPVYVVPPNLKQLFIAPIVPSDLVILFNRSKSNPSIQHRFSALRSLKLISPNYNFCGTRSITSSLFSQYRISPPRKS